MARLHLFAKDLTHTTSTIDTSSSESVIEEFNTIDLLREHGVTFSPMPEEHPLWHRNGKDGKVLVRMKDLGIYVLCRVDEAGQIINLFGRRGDFNKPLPISPATVAELKQIFSGHK